MIRDMNIRNRLKEHIKRKKIDPLDERDDLPVGLFKEKTVPIKGNVHIALGRTMSRDEIKKLFKKVRFA